MQGSEFIDMMKKVLGVTTNKELASFLGITAEHTAGCINKNLCPRNMLIGVSSMHTKKYRGEHENRLFKQPSVHSWSFTLST